LIRAARYLDENYDRYGQMIRNNSWPDYEDEYRVTPPRPIQVSTGDKTLFVWYNDEKLNFIRYMIDFMKRILGVG